MAKSLFGSSAILTGALLVGTLFFQAHPSVAEDLAQQTKQAQQGEAKTETAGASLSADNAPLLVATAAELKPAATAVRIEETDPGPPPPVGKRTLALPTIAATQLFTATAYSLRGRTASGRTVARGLIAADRRVLPLGTRVRLEAGAYSGEYLVADLGGAVRGRKIDIWMPSTSEAMRFGRRAIKLTILTPNNATATATDARTSR
ncbi:MAG: 3D domain-containing protein [Pyrinomonadaceae bacterium]